MRQDKVSIKSESGADDPIGRMPQTHKCIQELEGRHEWSGGHITEAKRNIKQTDTVDCKGQKDGCSRTKP